VPPPEVDRSAFENCRAAVVKVQLYAAASGPPAWPVAAVVIVAVYAVSYASSTWGVNVAVLPLVVTVPLTAGEMVNVLPSIELATIASENVALMVVPRATAAAPFAGLVETTVGAGTVVKL
jgi:hypothetical protein